MKDRSEFQMADSTLKFLNRIKEEVKNVANKLDTVSAGEGGTIKIGNHTLNPDMNKRTITEVIYKNIAEMAEVKINERRTRKHDLKTIQVRLNQILFRQIQNQTNQIIEKELTTYQNTVTNL